MRTTAYNSEWQEDAYMITMLIYYRGSVGAAGAFVAQMEAEGIAAAKERVANLKAKLMQQHTERLAKIEDSMQKLDEANRAKKLEEASKWMNIAFAVVGVVLAVAAAALAIASAGTAVGVAIAVFACIGAAATAANAGLTIYQEAAKDNIKQDIKDKAAEYREQGFNASEAMKKATEDVTEGFLIASCVLAGVSIVCGLVSAGGVVSNAAKVLSSVQTVMGGLSMAGGILGAVASNNANEANYDAQMSEADLSRLEALLEKLKKALEEDSDEIKVLLQQLMEAMADLSKLLESAQETTDQITGEIGATA